MLPAVKVTAIALTAAIPKSLVTLLIWSPPATAAQVGTVYRH
jgi:hypothetical protein